MPPKAATADTGMDKDLLYMWTCLKHSETPTLKIDWDAVAKACDINKGAASKRWSRLTKRLQDYVPSAPNDKEAADDGVNGFTAINANDGEQHEGAASPSMPTTPSKQAKKRKNTTTPGAKAGAGSKRKRATEDVGGRGDAKARAGGGTPVKAEAGSEDEQTL